MRKILKISLTSILALLLFCFNTFAAFTYLDVQKFIGKDNYAKYNIKDFKDVYIFVASQTGLGGKNDVGYWSVVYADVDASTIKAKGEAKLKELITNDSNKTKIKFSTSKPSEQTVGGNTKWHIYAYGEVSLVNIAQPVKFNAKTVDTSQIEQVLNSIGTQGFEARATYKNQVYTSRRGTSFFTKEKALANLKTFLDPVIENNYSLTEIKAFTEYITDPVKRKVMVTEYSISTNSTDNKNIPTISSGIWKGSEGSYWFDQGNGQYLSGNKWFYITTDGNYPGWENYYYWFDNEGYWRPQKYAKSNPDKDYKIWNATTNINQNLNNQSSSSNQSSISSSGSGSGGFWENGTLNIILNDIAEINNNKQDDQSKIVQSNNPTSVNTNNSQPINSGSNFISNNNIINNSQNTNIISTKDTEQVTIKNSQINYDNDLDDYLENGIFKGDIYKASSKTAKFTDLTSKTSEGSVWPGWGVNIKFAGGNNTGFFVDNKYFILSTSDEVLVDNNDKKISGQYGIEEILADGVYLIGSGTKYYVWEFDESGYGKKLNETATFNSSGEIVSGYTPHIDPDSFGIPIYSKNELKKVGSIYYTDYDSSDKENAIAIIDGYWLYNSSDTSYQLMYSNSNGTTSNKQSGTPYKLMLYINNKLGGDLDGATEGKKGSRNSSSVTKSSGSSENITTTSKNINETKSIVSKEETVKILFSSNGGTGTMKSIEGTKGSLITIPSNSFTKTDYTFKMWETNDGKLYKSGQKITIEDDLVLTAIWDKNLNKMTNLEKQDELDELEREKEELMKLLESYLN